MHHSVSSHVSIDQLHEQFLSILPRIRLHAEVYFRRIKCSHRQADAVQETVAIAWKWFRRLAERGKDATTFPSALAAYAARAVRSGRRVTGQEKAKDVLSPLSQQRDNFAINPIPNGSSLHGNVFDDALADNAVSPVPEQVAFRLDFSAWLKTYEERRRCIIEDLMLGERTLDVSNRHRLSPSRISQMRRCFHTDWRQFCGDAAS